MPQHEGNRGAECRDLCQREIDKNDVAPEHVKPERGVDAHQRHRDAKRQPQQGEGVRHVDHAYLNACASTPML